MDSVADELRRVCRFGRFGRRRLGVRSLAGLALVSIPIVLVARLIAVSVPISLLSLGKTFTPGSIPVLTWGGVRGGISVALALSLPMVAEKPAILLATYVVVIFSIVVQGLTVGRLASELGREPELDLE